MQKRKTNIPFKGTKEQEENLIALILSLKNEKGALMPILQGAQEIYGYLPIEVQQIISEKMGVSLEEVYGVVSFYSQFTLNPQGQYKISVCLGTACYVKGSKDILERLTIKLGIKPGEITPDGKFSLEATRCIGACGLAPIVTVNDEVYGRLLPDDVDKILAKYN
jgi:NADP-reducing hydrogenase subunit HndA